MKKRFYLLTVLTFLMPTLCLAVPAPASAKSILSVFKNLLFRSSGDAETKQDENGQIIELSRQRIVINVPAKELFFFEGERLIKSYKIAVGEPNHPSPIGQRLMTRLVWNPWWIPPKDQEWAQEYQDTAPGSDNPLGPVKMDIKDLYYIHGNNDPISIGHAVTHGCIRLLDEDAIEVAKRIQRRSAPNLDVAKFEAAIANKTENYKVMLEHPVIVDVIYELVELRDGKIYVYDDIYNFGHRPQRMIEEKLLALGVPRNKIRSQLLKRDLKQYKYRHDLVFDFNKYVKNFSFNDLAYQDTAELE